MTLTLDPATEQRLQQELAIGRYRGPADLIAHAPDLVKAKREDLATRRTAFFGEIEESIAQGERGEVFTEEEVRARMAARRAAHQAAHAA
jgi:predicted transcriptional regulator